MYNGDEKLINDGKYLSYSILDFWRWTLSNIILNVNRGAFAEFIVKCALEQGGCLENLDEKTGMEPYDLDGPPIKSIGRKARIEVKSAAFVQYWEAKHPDRANFGIAPAVMPDETGDYPENAPKQRNNDLYVFCLYTARDKKRNILDLSWWEFYVLPTYQLESDERLIKQKTISLKRVKELCKVLTFNELFDAISDACSSIPSDFRPLKQ